MIGPHQFQRLIEGNFVHHTEPDSAEVVVDIDDSKEKGSGEDLTDAVVTEDDNSEEVKSDLNENTDDDSKEGTADSFTPKCDKISLTRHRNFSKT